MLHNGQCVSWSFVMMPGPGVLAPLVWTFVPDVYPQSPKNVAIEFFIHHLAWWNKFLMHGAINWKRKKKLKNPCTLL
jgi:hypothetical protein